MERTPHADSLQAGHMANLRRRAAEGVLLGAGPFADDAVPLGVGRDYRARAVRADHPADWMVTYSLVMLRREGSLIFVGGVEGADDLRGLLAFAADTSEARRLAWRDPAVRAGRFVPEVHSWWVAFGVLPGH